MTVFSSKGLSLKPTIHTATIMQQIHISCANHCLRKHYNGTSVVNHYASCMYVACMCHTSCMYVCPMHVPCMCHGEVTSCHNQQLIN